MPAARRPALTLSPLEPRDVPAAQVQVIHDSPAAAAGTVDVYVNNVMVLNDLAFQQSSPFVTVADSVPLKIDVVAGAATTNAAPLTTRTVTLPPDARAIVAAVGVLGGAGPAALQLAVAPAARAAAADPADVDILVLHGTPDAGAVDVKVRGIGPVVNDLPTGTFNAGYVSVPAGQYVLDVTLADGVTPVGSFIADLTDRAGEAFVVAATGFAAPPAGGEPFGLLAVDSTGTGTLLPATSGFAETRFAVGGRNTATVYTPAGAVAFTVPNVFGEVFVGGAVPSVRTAVADVTGDGVPDLVAGAGPAGGTGFGSVVRVFDGVTRAVVREFTAFEAAFTGGVYVSAADLDADGFADIVVTPDQGGGPRVQIRDGETGNPLIGDYFGIEDPAFRGGARTAFADLNGDATPDLIVAAGFGGGPRVAAWDGLTLQPGGRPGKLFADFFVFEEALRNGAFVAGGDINNDGFDDLIAGGGPGGGPRVLALSGQFLTATPVAPGAPLTPATLANFFAGDQANRDGVRLAAKDLDGDYQVDIVAGLGSPGVAQVRAFAGRTVLNGANPTPAAALELNPLAAVPAGGVEVG